MEFSKIRFLASQNNLTIPQLAEKRMGIKKQTLYQIIKKGDCKVSFLEKISSALNVSPCYWWEGEEKYNQNKKIENLNEPKMEYSEVKFLKELLEEKQQRINDQADHIETLKRQLGLGGENTLTQTAR